MFPIISELYCLGQLVWPGNISIINFYLKCSLLITRTINSWKCAVMLHIRGYLCWPFLFASILCGGVFCHLSPFLFSAPLFSSSALFISKGMKLFSQWLIITHYSNLLFFVRLNLEDAWVAIPEESGPETHPVNSQFPMLVPGSPDTDHRKGRSCSIWSRSRPVLPPKVFLQWAEPGAEKRTLDHRALIHKERQVKLYLHSPLQFIKYLVMH